MSLHLLSSYESDGEGDEDNFTITYEDQKEEVQEIEKACGSHGENSSSIKGSFFFGGIDEISSSDEEEFSEPSIHASARKEISRRLPSAALLLNSNKVGYSVLESEKQREESAHTATLSQHVPLSESLSQQRLKQVCKAFKRGQCHRGDRCRFTHPTQTLGSQLTTATVQRGAEMYRNFDDVFSKKPRLS